MRPANPRFLIILILVLFLAAACSPDSPAGSPTIGQFESEIIPMTFTGASVVWPEMSAAECAPSLPAPSIKICLENTSGEAAYPEEAAVTLPAFLASAAFEQVLGSLPGGDWLPPHPITLAGIPGVSEGTEGIIIVNSNPAPDAAAVGLIIVNGIPVSSDVSSVFIVLQNMPDPLSAEGIIIVNSKVNNMATVGALALNFDIANLLNPSQPMSDSGIGPNFNQVAADITQDHFMVSGVVNVTEIYANLKNYHHIPMGIVWGGLVAGISQDQISASPITQEIDWGPPPDDNKPPPDDNKPPPDDSKLAIVWGGMPTDATGIIIINNAPSPDSESEGIIIVNSKEISQVMGIVVVDKPGENGSKGIVIQNSPPPDGSKAGIAWSGIVWEGSESSDGASQSIVIQNTPSGALSSLFGLPDGYGLPEGMMPMMGGNGSGPLAVGHISLEGDSYLVPAKEEKCFEIPLSGLVPYLPGTGDETFPVDSFFDVFTELTVDFPQKTDSSRIVSRIDPPNYPICTPTPGPISTIIPAFSSPTPTRKVPRPTPTPTQRHGLPTVTPTSTPVPQRNS